MNKLSASLEDYLEIICNLLETSKNIKAVEISKKLNISRAAVSEALSKLAEKKLIIYEAHKGIIVTEEGLGKAQQIILKHKTLTSFFAETLGLNREIAEENACKIEHVISDEVFDRIKSFQDYCINNLAFIENFKKEFNQTGENE